MADVSANAFAAESPNMQRTGGPGGKRKRGFDQEASTPTRRTARVQQPPQQDPATESHSMSGYPGADFDISALSGSVDQHDSVHNAAPPAQMHSASPQAHGQSQSDPFHMNVPGQPSETFQSIAAPENDNNEFRDDAPAPGSVTAAPAASTPSGSRATSNKPQVGTEEWHKVRKDNHKEVERRRRETINEGINELGKIVPGCERNKGQILSRAVQYIQRLQDDASTSIDKWTFEKLVTEQAINEISAKCHKALAERDAWRRIAMEAGVDVENVDLGIDEEALQREIDSGGFAAAEKDAKRVSAEKAKAAAAEGREMDMEASEAA